MLNLNYLGSFFLEAYGFVAVMKYLDYRKHRKMIKATREQLPLMLDQQKLVEENRLLHDQLDHAQSLITTPVKDYVKLELQLQEMDELVRALEKELIQVYRDKAELNRKISDLLSRIGATNA